MQLNLRDYQQECVDTIDKQGREGRHLVAMATGLGKTAIFANIKRNGRVLILSHRDELVHQPQKYYEGCSFGVEEAGEHSSGEEIVSASVQTLSRDSRLIQFSPDDFYTIIVDEAHHAAAPTYKKVINYFSGAKQILGVTATPKRGDNIRLTDVFDDIIFSRDLRWGIQHGWLSSIRCERVEATYTLSGVGMTAGDFNVGELDEAINPETLATAAKAYVKECHKKGRRTLIYCVSTKCCAMLHGIISNLLDPSERDTIKVLTGKTDRGERKEILDAFQDGSVRCIINCMVLTEGTDLPMCDAVINLRPTCNPTLFQQIVGRGTRPYDGKDYCLVIDIVPSDNRKIRHLCTAPTLFGIDPSMLPKNIVDKFNQDVDLLELCEEIAGTIGTGTEIAGRMEVSVMLAEAFIQGQTELILGEGEGKDGLKGAARRIKEYEEQTLDSSGYDFGGLYVTVMPEENRRFVIKPSWAEEIYLSEPDVLGNITVDFNVCVDGTGIKRHYIGEMRFDKAITLIRKFCMLRPEYQWYSWDRDLRKQWENLNATPNQIKKLNTCYRDLGLSCKETSELNKLEAGYLIDRKLEINKKKAYIKKYKTSKNQRQKTKDRMVQEFSTAEQEEQRAEEKGKRAFSQFVKQVETSYARREQQLEREREIKKQSIEREKSELEKGEIIIPASTQKQAGKCTMNQASFIQSLIFQVSRLGYPMNKQMSFRDMSCTEASVAICILLYIVRNKSKRIGAPFCIDLQSFLDATKEVAKTPDDKDHNVVLRLYKEQNCAEPTTEAVVETNTTTESK